MPYITSDLYKEAIRKETKTTFIDGEIKPVGGPPISITNDMLDTGSVYITNQCVNSDAFEIGSVFAAELGLTLKSEIDRYTLYDANVTLNYNILLSDGTYEKVPLGEFTVNEPSRVGRNIVIKAYDDMLKLDEELFESLTGRPYELLAYISARCGVSLSQSRVEIEQLTNGNVLLDVDVDKVKTYRELLSYICKVTCTFAIFDRTGKLKLCEYSSSLSKVIESRVRTTSKFSDFETYFSGAKAGLIYNDEYKNYMQTDEGAGVIYDLGNIPVVQGLDSTNQIVISNIAFKLSSIRYTPCDITFSGDPSIELGDLIQNIDRNGNEILSLVTYYKWTYRGRHQIKSAGQNPKLLKIKGQSEKELEGLKSDISSKEMTVYTYTNASKVTLQGGEVEDIMKMSSLTQISFAAKKASTCVVMVTIPLNMSDDSNVEFHQLFDGSEMLGGVISHRCHKGLNTITFTNYFSTKSNAIHKYSIVGITKGVDENEPGELTVEPYSLKTIIFGQGLSATVHWDGIITVNDIIPLIPIENATSIINLSDELMTEAMQYNPNIITDSISEISIKSDVTVLGLTDNVQSIFDF